MEWTLVRRVVGIVVLLGLVFGMGLHMGIDRPPETNPWPYPRAEEVGTEYDRYVGSETLLWGSVEQLDTATRTAVIDVRYDGKTVRLNVTDFDADVESGGTVQVYGTLQPGHTIEATNVVVVNPVGSSTTVKYAVSAVGAVLVLLLFFRRWRPDTTQWAFVPREESDG